MAGCKPKELRWNMRVGILKNLESAFQEAKKLIYVVSGVMRWWILLLKVREIII